MPLQNANFQTNNDVVEGAIWILEMVGELCSAASSSELAGVKGAGVTSAANVSGLRACIR